jgi:hypothetical protein
MSVNGRDPKRKKSEINKLESKSSNTAALFMYPGVLMSFVGGDGAVVKWGEKGGPKKEEAGEVTVVHNYLSNLRPRVTLGGGEYVRFHKGSKGNGGHGMQDSMHASSLEEDSSCTEDASEKDEVSIQHSTR